jgi:hypothetical protein
MGSTATFCGSLSQPQKRHIQPTLYEICAKIFMKY